MTRTKKPMGVANSGSSKDVDAPAGLLARIRSIWERSLAQAARSVNTAHVCANWLIGQEIIEAEQSGSTRAGYGQAILKNLADRLSTEFGSGFSLTALKHMRSFYLAYPELLAKGHAVRDLLQDHGAGTRRASTVHVYLIGTANLWVLMGSTRVVDAEKAKSQTTEAPDLADKLVGSIGYYLVDCSDKGIDESSAEAQQAVSMSLFALSHTPTFDESKRVTSIYSGHWLCFIHRLKDGNVLARLGFIGAKGPGLLSPAELHGIPRKIVAGDTSRSASGFIASEIRRGGGVRLYEILQ